MPHVIVGTAGHIDHGKTALVKALTGIDADRLKEEKERGITIDIGFASLSLDSSTTIGFIDVPGHERFIKNMLAGIGGIDLVLLVIAADESVMPQTREHLDICSLLHIRQGLTVLTKVDKISTDLADVAELEVREFLKGSFLEHSPVVRVSSETGEGMPHLIETLRELAKAVRPKEVNDILRLPIDRCFTMKGFGTVVTGTLIAGLLRKEQEVEILPSRRRTRVRGIQVHGRTSDEALAGQRTAVNLQGVELAEIRRGMVLTIPNVFQAVSMIDGHLELLPSVRAPIESRKRVRFHAGTTEVMGYVSLLGQDRLEAGEQALVQVRLEEPAFVLPGDRFIIRQYSPMITIGGGEVLDIMPEKHKRSDSAVIHRLQTLKQGSIKDRMLVFIEDAGLKAIDLSQLVARTGVAPERAREHLVQMAELDRIRVLDRNASMVISASVFKKTADQVVSEIQRFHREYPLVLGMGREDLRARLFGRASTLVFESILSDLASAEKIAVVHDVVHEFGRKIALKEDEKRIRNQLAKRFHTFGLQAPSPAEVIQTLELDKHTARKIIELMVKENALAKITDDLIIERAAIDKLIETLKTVKAQKPEFGVGEFKTLTGVSRKFAIPLLEYLDRQRITRRVGERRRIL